MRMFKRIALAVAATGVLLGGAAGTASAATTSASPAHHVVCLTGGHTSLTTAPGIATALLSHGIVPLATLPATEGVSTSNGVAVKFTFPATGGSLNLKKLTGTISHSGGILFISPSTGKQISVSNFVIDLKAGDLTAVVNGNPKMRVPLLSLSLAHAKVIAGRHSVQLNGVVAALTKTAAGALNATFGTTLFTTGMVLGTANAVADF